MPWLTFMVFGTLFVVGDFRDKVLLRRDRGLYLRGSVIRVVRANNEYDCGIFCSQEPLCLSVNYRSSGKDKGRCELNDKSLKQPQHIGCTRNPEYSYQELVKPQCEEKSNYSPVGLYTSLILGGNADYINQLITWLNNQKNWRLCYRATQNGWGATDFHSLCDNKGPTVTIVRVQDYIFGGYSDVSWGGSWGYRVSVDSFLFSFQNKGNLAPFKSPLYKYGYPYAIYNSPYCCPVFGGGHDLYISSNARESVDSYTNFGFQYQLPAGYTRDSPEAKSLLAGASHFTPSEVEVFYLDQ